MVEYMYIYISADLFLQKDVIRRVLNQIHPLNYRMSLSISLHPLSLQLALS